MGSYFTVDRAGTLTSGQQVVLRREFDSDCVWSVDGGYTANEAIQRVLQLFPDGLSTHGSSYLLYHGLVVFRDGTREPTHLTPVIPMIETVSEFVRRLEFPERPSRMQAMFGWCDFEDALRFNAESGGTAQIYSVESDDAFVGDQTLLYLGGSVAGALEYSRRYWSGESGPSPRLEAVIPLPATVGPPSNKGIERTASALD